MFCYSQNAFSKLQKRSFECLELIIEYIVCLFFFNLKQFIKLDSVLVNLKKFNKNEFLNFKKV